MLGWFADAPDPDAGLLGFRRISESLGDSPWYLRLLRDEGEVAERLARLLATSRYATDLLLHAPQAVRHAGGGTDPTAAEALTTEMRSSASRQDEPEAAVRAIRAIRRRELFRVAAGDLLGHTDIADIGAALSRLTDATLEATLEVANGRWLPRSPSRNHRPGWRSSRWAARRLRALLRQRRGRDLRARADAGVEAHAGDVVRPGRCQRDPQAPDRARLGSRRWRWTPTSAPKASRDRWCARSTRTPPTTRSGRRCGRCRPC